MFVIAVVSADFINDKSCEWTGAYGPYETIEDAKKAVRFLVDFVTDRHKENHNGCFFTKTIHETENTTELITTSIGPVNVNRRVVRLQCLEVLPLR